MPAKKKARKIELDDLLRAIDSCDFDFYSRLDAEQKKEFSAWTTMRWASSSRDFPEHYLLMVNDIVNKDFNLLTGSADDPKTQHPELQWKLIATCGIGRVQQKWRNRQPSHPWIPPPKKPSSKIGDFLHRQYPTLNYKELKLLEELNTKDDLKQLAKDTGMSDKDIKDLFK